MIGLMGGVFNCGVDVFTFEERIVCQDFIETRTVRQKLKYVRDAKTLPTDARTASAFAVFNGNSFESIRAHSFALN